MNLVIRLVFFYLLDAEGEPSNWIYGIVLREAGREVVVALAVDVSWKSTRSYSDAFADTSVRDSAGLSNRVDPPYTLRRAYRTQNQPSANSQP